jgi:glyoxylase-like metal-dependent hydrolase (beta-lactamase superfamily II)
MLEKYNLGSYCHKDDDLNGRVPESCKNVWSGWEISNLPVIDRRSDNFIGHSELTIHVPGHAPGSLAFIVKKG